MENERKHIKVLKIWGSEEWFENNDLYCGKLLIIYKDFWTSNGKYHYHSIKDECFFILEGELLLHVLENDADPKTIVLRQGESYRIKPGIKHKFTAIDCEVCKLIEVSTKHMEDDSIRC